MVYCVVLLTGSECEEMPAVTCVLEVLGPYATRDAAVAAAKREAPWTVPHVMALHPPRETSAQLRALLSGNQYAVFTTVADADGTPLTGRAIGRLLDISPSTAIRALEVLERAGLASRQSRGRADLWRVNGEDPMVHSLLSLRHVAGDGGREHA